MRVIAAGARPRIHLILLLLAAFLLHAAGLQRTLPLLPEVDEGIFVEAGIRVAATGNLDPGFYGNPGSTLIYPLAAGYRLWHAWTRHGTLLHADPLLMEHFQRAYGEYYFLGRLLAVGYSMAAVALVALLGRRAWGSWRVGLAAGWLVAINGITVYHAKMVRTDSAGMFFGLLAAWLALRLLEGSAPDNQPSLGRQVAAGAAVGLAAASRYFAGAAGLLLVVINLGWMRRVPGAWKAALAGLAAIPVAFLIANPAMLPNATEVIADLRVEARATHLGADGLSPLGNLAWYLTRGLWEAVGILAGVAVAGLAATWLQQRQGEDRRGAWLLLLYFAAFVALISLSALHWARWLIPVLPVVLLFAAAGLDAFARAAAARLRWSGRRGQAIFAAGLAALMLLPLGRLIRLDIRHVGPNTRLEARAWMVEHLPPGSHILQESYGAPLGGTTFVEEAIRAVPDAIPAGGDLDSLRERGYDYVVASSDIYNRFFAEAERYPSEVAFYERLFTGGSLVQEFAPTWRESGPVLRIYQP